MRATQRWTLAALIALASAGIVACSGNSNSTSPTAPTSATGSGAAGSGGVSGGSSDLTSNANPDGSTLKATAPGNLAPTGNTRLDTRTPTLTWTNATGRFLQTGFSYELEFYKVNDLAFRVTVAQGAGGTTSYTVPSELDYDTIYRWRVRATLGTAFGPWPATATFATPLPPPPPVAPPVTGGGGGQPFGPQRNIGINEAFGMLVAYHNASGVDLGSRSTRDGRVAWFFSAVAIVHYGHPVFNPAGGDRGWCVKDGGGGRPPSDDVIVRCGSRDFWDTIVSAGADGYQFALHYEGILPSNQNVYAPPLGSLPR